MKLMDKIFPGFSENFQPDIAEIIATAILAIGFGIVIEALV
jgi:hypothetical protein